MDYYVTPIASLTGELTIPGDKSISHRALMISAIANGKSKIKGLLMGADNLATLHALQQLGVTFKPMNENDFVVEGVGLQGLRPSKSILDLGNSGTGIRLLTGLLAGQKFDSTLTGDPSLCKRPMGRIVEPLKEMGASMTMTDKGTCPLKIRGNQPLHGIRYSMPMASAQVKSCLLFAGLYAKGKTTIIEPAPSRDHTERMLQNASYPIEINHHEITLSGGHDLKPIHLKIPADISSAAFFIVAATLVPDSDVLLKNIGINPTRIGIITILKEMGANIELLNHRQEEGEPVADIRVRYAPLKGIEIPVEQIPLAIDEFPVILIASACAKGKTILRHAKELRVKETDRINAMAKGLTELGIEVETLEDGMIVQGGKIQGGKVNSFKDHRIAMAFSVAGNVATSPITIQDCRHVETSFPNFLECAKKIGMMIHAK